MKYYDKLKTEKLKVETKPADDLRSSFLEVPKHLLDLEEELYVPGIAGKFKFLLIINSYLYS